MISEFTVIKKNSVLKPVSINNQLSMLNLETGKYCVINDIGACIWDFAEDSISVAELINKLTEVFNVTYEDCKNSVVPYLKTLETEKLIEIVRL